MCYVAIMKVHFKHDSLLAVGMIRTYNRSLRGKVKPDERQSHRNGGNSPQSMKNKDHIEALGTEFKSLKMELESMRSCRLDARSSEMLNREGGKESIAKFWAMILTSGTHGVFHSGNWRYERFDEWRRWRCSHDFD